MQPYAALSTSACGDSAGRTRTYDLSRMKRLLLPAKLPSHAIPYYKPPGIIGAYAYFTPKICQTEKHYLDVKSSAHRNDICKHQIF